MNIAELQIEIHAINVAKGWHDKPLKTTSGCAVEVYTDRVLAKLALVHSELCEAEEEAAADLFDVYYRDDKPTKPEGWIVEIADALIHVLDTCEALGLECHSIEEQRFSARTSLHAYVSSAVEAARVGDYTGAFVDALVGLWQACEIEADRRQLDLASAIKLKIAYNRTRPHMHGGKLA